MCPGLKTSKEKKLITFTYIFEVVNLGCFYDVLDKQIISV